MKRLLLIFALFLLPVKADRLFTSGFETNDFTNTEWNAASASAPSIQGTTVHSGTYAMEVSTSANQKWSRWITTSTVTSGTYFVRFYFRVASGTGRVAAVASNADSLSFDIALNGSNQLVLTNTADSSTITSSALTANTWYRVEYRLVISDTVGELELYLDGTSQGSLTSKDTLPTNVQRFYFGNVSSSATFDYFYDDVAINDTGGTFQTTLAGAGKIGLMKPGGDNTVTWTKTGANCSGTTNTDCVDDVPGAPDFASGYNDTSSVQTDRFDIATLPAEITSDADMILIHVMGTIGGSSTTGTNTFRFALWDDGGTKTTGPTSAACDVNGWNTIQVGGVVNSLTYVYDLGTKTKANTQSFDIGYEPVSLNQTCRATALWANVEWIEGAGTTRNRSQVIGQ